MNHVPLRLERTTDRDVHDDLLLRLGVYRHTCDSFYFANDDSVRAGQGVVDGLRRLLDQWGEHLQRLRPSGATSFSPSTSPTRAPLGCASRHRTGTKPLFRRAAVASRGGASTLRTSPRPQRGSTTLPPSPMPPLHANLTTSLQQWRRTGTRSPIDASSRSTGLDDSSC